MKREVIFNWKILLFLLPGLLAGAYHFGAGASWREVWIWSIVFGLFSLCLAVFFFHNVANYMADRQLEGKSVLVAGLPIFGVIAGGCLGVIFFDDIDRVNQAIRSWIHCIGGCSR